MEGLSSVTEAVKPRLSTYLMFNIQLNKGFWLVKKIQKPATDNVFTA